MILDKSKIKKSFTFQNSQSSCGLACLVSISKLYGKYANEEQLKVYSGTTTEGTTILGLVEASKVIGLNAEGYEANIKSLKSAEQISILHVVNANGLSHFVVCYGFDSNINKFIIGDPEIGIVEYTSEEIDIIWDSKLLLLISPIEEIGNNIKDAKYDKRSFIKALISPDFNLLLISFLLSLFTSSMNFITAIFTEKLVDKVLPSKDFAILINAVGLYFFFIIISSFISYVRTLFVIRQSKYFNIRLITRFLDKVFSLSISFFNSVRKGEVLSRMQETERIQGIIVILINTTLVDIITLGFSIIILMYYSIQISLIAALSIPVVIFVSRYFAKKIRIKQKQLMNEYADFEAYSVESFSGIRFVKNFIKELFFINRLKQKYTNIQETSVFLGTASAQYDLSINIIGSFFSVLAILVGGYFFIIGRITVGELVAIITILTLTMSTTIEIISVLIQIQEASVSMERLYDIISTDDEQTVIHSGNDVVKFDTTINIELELRSISFRYPGQTILLKDIDMKIQKGQFVTLFGDIGTGKSTLLHLIQRYYPIEKGKILFNNEDVSKYSLKEWRKELGIVSQDTRIFMGTVADNIAMFDKERYEELESFCNKMGLHCFLEEGSLYLANPLNEEGNNLSGGQKQLIGFARALFSKSSILILDEPTASMDKTTELLMMSILNAIKKDYIIIMITHKPEIAKKTDNIYVLMNSTIKIVGTHDELMKSDNIYSSSYRALF